jgi:phospholipid/cholesterol/gamma-HCH transport system ATP-binding protein
MIQIESVHKSFSDNHVLRGITMDFHQGQTNLIIGQSGSGKTVLLKCLVGLHEIDDGEIYYDERKFTEMSFKTRKDLRKEIGMLFQGGALFDSLTVEENVIFPLEMFTKMSHEERLERANFCLNRVNIVNANHLYPAEISGGMKKRVAIARAIAQNPKYLFCDEPNSGLDPRTSIVIDQLISELTYEFNMTTIVNTHDMNSVAEIGDNILFLHQGEKCWTGNKKDIFTSDNETLNKFIFATKLMKRIKQTA